jgi:ribosomal small subunit protein bTHX
MGKGDKKTRRGKIFAGSFGVRRSRKLEKSAKVKSPEKTVKAVKTAKTVKPRKKASDEVA